MSPTDVVVFSSSLRKAAISVAFTITVTVSVTAVVTIA